MCSRISVGSPALLGGEGDEIVERGAGGEKSEGAKAVAKLTHRPRLLAVPSCRRSVRGRRRRRGGGWARRRSRTRGSSGSTTGERHGGFARATSLVENVGDRLGGEGAAPVCLGEREVELGGAVLIEQVEQSASWCRRDVRRASATFSRNACGAGARGHQSVATAVLARVALVVGEAVEVTWVFDLATSLPAARVDGDLVVAVEHAHERGRRRRASGAFATRRVGDRVVVAVEAQVRRLAGAQSLDGIAVEGMRGQRQEPRPLLGEGGGDGALVGVAGDDARVGDALDPVVELGD